MRAPRYPDDVLWNILHEKAAYYGVTAHLKQSLNYPRSRDFWSESEKTQKLT
jgi:hypothetical protein